MCFKACGRMTSLDRSCRVLTGALLLFGALFSLGTWYFALLGLASLFSGLLGQCMMAKWVKEKKK